MLYGLKHPTWLLPGKRAFAPGCAGFRESVFQAEAPAGVAATCSLGQVCPVHLLSSGA